MNLETSRRECEVVRKGMQCTEKQLRQLILNDLDAEPVDISLIKKYKTVVFTQQLEISRNLCRDM